MFKKIISNNKLLIPLLLSVFVFGFLITYFSFKFSKIFDKKVFPEKTTSAYAITTPEPVDTSSEGIFNILLLGYGGMGHSGGGITDSIIIVHIDTNTKNYALISVPRDLWVQGNHKINAEASINGYQNIGSAIKGITSLVIDNYIAVDFSNYSKIIDNLGGITVNVPVSFTDSFYPISGMENETCGISESQINEFKIKFSGFELEKQFICRYETISYQKGPVTLDGTAALKFVRSRHGDSDFGRSARQFAVLAGIEKKLISLKSLNKLDSTIDTFTNMVRTDLTLGKIKTLIEVFGDASEYTGKEIHLTTENVLNEGKSSDGAYILYPKAGSLNFSEVKKFISENIFNH